MTSKTQTLPFDTGDTPGLYSTYSEAFYESSAPEKLLEKYLRNAYLQGQRSATQLFSGDYFITSGDSEGLQSFESTERPRPKFNACKNSKDKGFNFPFGICYKAYNSSVMYLTPYSRLPSVSGCRGVARATDLTAFWADTEASARRAWWSMRPSFDGQVSLLNSIFELKDFRDVAKTAIKFDYYKLLNGFTDCRKAFDLQAKRAGFDPYTTDIGTVKRLFDTGVMSARAGSTLYLAYRLAIDPTYRDMLSIMAQMGQAVQQVQDDFAENGMSLNRSHFREKIFSDTTMVPGTGNNYWFNKTTRTEATFNASMEYTYQYRRRPLQQAFRRYWGLDLTADVIWNALPFTFVADYFATIGDSIRSMSPDPNVTLTPTQYAESILVTSSQGYQTSGDGRVRNLIINGVNIPHGQENVPINGWECSFYERRLGLPNRGSALPRLKWPSTSQVAVIAALLICLL